MDEKKLKALAAELAKGLKTEADLNQFSRMLTKLTVETALNAELTDHLGHEKNAPKTGSNTRNGYSSKTVLCDDGEIELNTPRDRENTFEPQLIKKHQTRITQMDSQILSLYAKGMTTREIVATFKEMYDADVSPTLISKVTDAVKEQVTEWQNRQLDALYPIVYMDCIVVKVRQNGSVINKAVFLALGINIEGQKELLGMWLAENEGAKFWLSVLTELKNRGLQDILIACVDGLKGFPDAINSVFPQTHIQLCIIHMVRNSLKYVSWKDYKAVTSGLKAVWRRKPAENVIVHSDQGSQYGSDDWQRFCRANNLAPSMSRRGNCWDNAVAESFFSSLKKERIRKRIYKTRDMARADIFDYIEVFYNRTRRHSHLGGVSPEAFEKASP
ncbi:IS256 family transposase [Salmonella enterica]|nr:IS256 family transposase [Salmonella enterica]EAP0380300.1 IS256 family transposase [Salmonella enterica]EBQ7680632.1 IS256 family transposase [Salmonella enterica]